MTKRSLFLKVLLPLICVIVVVGVFLGVYFGVKAPKVDAPNSNAPAKLEGDELTERNFEMTLDGDHYILSSAKVNDLVEVEIPETYRGLPVTVVAGHAFQNHTETLTLKTPESIEEVGSEAFLNCSSLKEVYMEYYPESMDNSGSAADAFVGCVSIEKVTVNSGIFGVAFAYAQIDMDTGESSGSLTTVILGNGVKTIGAYAFIYCSGITTLTIPEGVERLEEVAIFAMHNLKHLYLPSTLRYMFEIGSIGDLPALETLEVAPGGEYYCSNDSNCLIEKQTKTLVFGFKNTVIPTDGSVTSIDKAGFNSCLGFSSILIPSCITNIGPDVFAGCNELETVIFEKGIDWNAISLVNTSFGWEKDSRTFDVHVSSEEIGALAQEKLQVLDCQKTINIIVD